ncbi:GPCR kinase [Tanacetum coccineum]
MGYMKNYLNNEKLEQVVAIIKSCTLNALGDLTMTLKDISGTIHYKVLNEGVMEKDITLGASLILQNVLAFSPKPSIHYLNITMRNLVKVFPKDTVLENGSGVEGSEVEIEAFDFEALEVEAFDFDAFKVEAFDFVAKAFVVEAFEAEAFDIEAKAFVFEAFEDEAFAFEAYEAFAFEVFEVVDFEASKPFDLEAFEALDFEVESFKCCPNEKYLKRKD